jgi:hypothetical protein
MGRVPEFFFVMIIGSILVTRIVVARLDRATQYSRDAIDRNEKPRRTGSPLARGMTASVVERAHHMRA